MNSIGVTQHFLAAVMHTLYLYKRLLKRKINQLKVKQFN